MQSKTMGQKLTCRPIAAGEGIPNKALVANADWHMIPHAAVGIHSTEAWTWVLTLPVDARLVSRTI
jgi:hypothetical protein